MGVAVIDAVDNFAFRALLGPESAMESAGRESASTLDPGPDHQHLVRGAKAMIPTTAPNVSAQPLSCGRRA